MAVHGSTDAGVLCRVCDAGAFKSIAAASSAQRRLPCYWQCAPKKDVRQVFSFSLVAAERNLDSDWISNSKHTFKASIL